MMPPIRDFSAASLPLLKSATALGFAVIAAWAADWSAPESAIFASPFSLTTSPGERPLSTISAKTSLALAPVSLPASTRPISSSLVRAIGNPRLRDHLGRQHSRAVHDRLHHAVHAAAHDDLDEHHHQHVDHHHDHDDHAAAHHHHDDVAHRAGRRPTGGRRRQEWRRRD